LIDFLVQRFTYRQREGWIQKISSGAIKVNGEQVDPDWILVNRDIVSYIRPRSEEPKIDTRYNILYVDDLIVVVEKNGNIPISESGKYYQNTLLNILKEGEGFPELYAVHRLDKETSGVLLIARTKEVATQLGKQFFQRIPEKEYHAILRGEFREPEILTEAPIKKVKKDGNRVGIRQEVTPEGKPSKTLFIAKRVQQGLTLAKVKLFTGRTHQIRCHAEYAGFPILGDKLYGQTDETFVQIMKGEREPVYEPYGRIERQLLHASYLSFFHPKTGRKMRFHSDYRSEFLQYACLKNLVVE